MEIKLISDNSTLIILGKIFPVLAGFSRGTESSIFLAFDAEETQAAIDSDFSEILAPAVTPPSNDRVRRIPYNCPVSLPFGWRLSALPSGCLGGCSWLFQRCNQRILVASNRLNLSRLPRSPVDFLITRDLPQIGLSEILKFVIASQANRALSLFEGSWAPAEAAAALGAVAVVGEVSFSISENYADFYEFQSTEIKLQILSGKKLFSENICFAKSIGDLDKLPAAIFVPRGSAEIAEKQIREKFPGITINHKICEPERPGLDALKAFFPRAKIITQSCLIPAAETRTLTAPLPVRDGARVAILTAASAVPHLLAI